MFETLFTAYALSKVLAFSAPQKIDAFSEAVKPRNYIERYSDLPNDKGFEKFIGFLPGIFGSIPIDAVGLISSVEQVSITINTSSVSNTATLSTSVDTARSHVLFQGFTATATTTVPDEFYSRIELTNSTTVTAYRNTGAAGNTVTVRGVVIQWQSGVTSSIQSGAITLTAAASNTATISSVTTTRSAVLFLGATTTSGSGALSVYECIVELTNSTTVTASRITASGNVTVGYVVIQFASGVLNSNVQQSNISVGAGSTTNTATISSVTTGNTMIFWGGRNSDSPGFIPYRLVYLELTNSTTLTATKGNTSNTSVVNFTVVEFKTADVTLIQRANDTIATGNTTKDTTITAVDTAKAFVNFLGFTINSNNTIPAEMYSTVHLQSTTAVRNTRNTSDASFTVINSHETIQLT